MSTPPANRTAARKNAGNHGKISRREWPATLGDVIAVGGKIQQVVHDIGTGGDQAEAEKCQHGLHQCVHADRVRQQQRQKDQHIFGPLMHPQSTPDGARLPGPGREKHSEPEFFCASAGFPDPRSGSPASRRSDAASSGRSLRLLPTYAKPPEPKRASSRRSFCYSGKVCGAVAGKNLFKQSEMFRHLIGQLAVRAGG